MELRDFAEQVLFATTLEGKLQRPAVLTDDHPGGPIASPKTPGRPLDLRIKPSGVRSAPFPTLQRLDQTEERGRLLHFFANHEMLATELMALALLRFPEAPAAFRRGVLQTLLEEQEHTRLYLRRMSECGVHFGDLPVSGYFWRAISGMESPLDYVAGLSLTFEQANLDFAQQFSRDFATIGDTATSNLLQGIYQDEIRHVAYGLHWFRKWKQPEQSDWEAYCHQLKFPLSPQRAKGLLLNVEGRRAAGLPEDFISRLNVYSHSKGRTPNLFLFNPFAEAYIAQGRSFSPVKHQALLAYDLAGLPQFLCRQDDIVLLPTRPSLGFLETLKAARFPLPEFVETNTALFGYGPKNEAPSLAELSQRKLGGLRPWAWGPDSFEALKPLFASVTGEPRPGTQLYNPKIAELYSKAWSADFLRRALQETDLRLDSSWLCSVSEVAIAPATLAEAFEAIACIRARGHAKVIVKEALGLAGSNSLRLWEPEILARQRRWIQRALESGRVLVIEPWLERAADFSVQMEMTPQGLQILGYTGLINDLKGQFLGNWASPGWQRNPPSLASWVAGAPRDLTPKLQRVYETIRRTLERELSTRGFVGSLGIDAFLYHDALGHCQLKPVVEINPRHTMGRLTLELMRHASPGSHGLFRLVSSAAAQREGAHSLLGYATSLRQQHPIVLKGAPERLIHEGAVCLNDPERAQVCLATFQVARHSLRESVAPPPRAHT